MNILPNTQYILSEKCSASIALVDWPITFFARICATKFLSIRQSLTYYYFYQVVVLGGGSFGTAMAVLLARNKADMNVTLLLRDEHVCESINERHVNS
jgi:hypothetical protein